MLPHCLLSFFTFAVAPVRKILFIFTFIFILTTRCPDRVGAPRAFRTSCRPPHPISYDPGEQANTGSAAALFSSKHAMTWLRNTLGNTPLLFMEGLPAGSFLRWCREQLFLHLRRPSATPPPILRFRPIPTCSPYTAASPSATSAGSLHCPPPIPPPLPGSPSSQHADPARHCAPLNYHVSSRRGSLRYHLRRAPFGVLRVLAF